MEFVRALKPLTRLRVARRREAAAREVARAASATLPIARRSRPWRGIPSNPGLVGAEIASWAAFAPSLMPRPWASTAMVSFGAQVTGHVVGVAVGYGFRLADARLRRTKLGRFAPSVRTERLIALSWHGSMTAATAWVWWRSIQHQQTVGALVGMDALSSARAQFGGTAMASGAYLATQGLTFAAEFAFDRLRRVLRPWVPRGVAPVTAGIVVGGGLGLARIRDIAMMMPVAIIQKIKAKRVVIYGLLRAIASAPLLRMVPVPRIMTENAAPKAAAWEIPRVNGEPSGFLRTDCIPAPAIARPIPATIAASACGSRIFQIGRASCRERV